MKYCKNPKCRFLNIKLLNNQSFCSEHLVNVTFSTDKNKKSYCVYIMELKENITKIQIER